MRMPRALQVLAFSIAFFRGPFTVSHTPIHGGSELYRGDLEGVRSNILLSYDPMA